MRVFVVGKQFEAIQSVQVDRLDHISLGDKQQADPIPSRKSFRPNSVKINANLKIMSLTGVVITFTLDLNNSMN